MKALKKKSHISERYTKHKYVIRDDANGKRENTVEWSLPAGLAGLKQHPIGSDEAR